MAARRVVVVGDAMLDIYLAGDAERISPEAPVPVVTVHTRRAALGGAANVAANVSAIGAECRLVAVIGDDARGDSLRTELAQNRLADRHIVVAAARPTTSKTRVTARGQQVVRIDEEVEDPIAPRAENQLLGQQLVLSARRDRVLHFFVDTHHLLAAGGDARLRRGGARGGDDDVAVGEPVLC